MSTVTPAQLAFAAEHRVLTLLIRGDEEVSGMDPSRVRELSKARAEYLDAQLADVPAYALDDCTASQRDQAFADAATEISKSFAMINAVLDHTQDSA